jgi:hypothetical protein
MPDELIDGQPAGDAPAEGSTANDTTPEPSLEEAALAALDEGLAAERSAEQEGGTGEAKAPEPKEPKPAADLVPGTPEAAAAEAAKVEAAKKAEEGEPAKPERDEATETEIAALGLKEKAAERFRALTGEVKELAPIKEALEKAGIKDVAELPQLAQHAQFGRELYQQVQETGATAEQYGMSLDYLRVAAKANKGDLKAAEQAFAIVQEEMVSLARMLGKDVPGVVDPLADYPDLVQKVADGDFDRVSALEIARARTTEAMSRVRQTASEQHGQAEAARNQAAQDLNALGAELSVSDPHYAAKAPILVAQLQQIRDDLPPAKWAAAARRLYAAIPNPVAAPAPAPAAPAKPTPGPVRGNAVRPVVAPVTDDPMEALEQGIAAANR